MQCLLKSILHVVESFSDDIGTNAPVWCTSLMSESETIESKSHLRTVNLLDSRDRFRMAVTWFMWRSSSESHCGSANLGLLQVNYLLNHKQWWQQSLWFKGIKRSVKGKNAALMIGSFYFLVLSNTSPSALQRHDCEWKEWNSKRSGKMRTFPGN